jgi:aryl-alcohol dehydrogenase-like predicted oxidoreductase
MILLNLIRRWGMKKNASPAQISLAWLLAVKPFIVPIPGTTKLHHMEEDLGALDVRFAQEELAEVGKRHGATAGQIALAWLYARKPFIVPIPGTQNPFHMVENVRALDVQLTSDDMETIEQGFAEIDVMGARSTEQVLGDIDHGALLGTTKEDGKGLSPWPGEG